MHKSAKHCQRCVPSSLAPPGSELTALRKAESVRDADSAAPLGSNSAVGPWIRERARDRARIQYVSFTPLQCAVVQPITHHKITADGLEIEIDCQVKPHGTQQGSVCAGCILIDTAVEARHHGTQQGSVCAGMHPGHQAPPTVPAAEL